MISESMPIRCLSGPSLPFSLARGSLGVYSQPVDKFSNLPELQVSSSVKNIGTNDNSSGMIVMGIEREDIAAGLARRMPTVNVDCLS